MAIKLHIGCGDKQFPKSRAYGWTNVDARDLPGIDVVTEMYDLNMFEADSVDLIYACHVLEHVQRDMAVLAMQEWSAVLKPQVGELYVCVPDMEFIAAAMVIHGTHLGRLRGLIWGGQNYPLNIHYTGWDYEELARDLRDAGFFNIERYDAWEFMQPNIPPVFRDFSFMEMDGRPCSLNVKAIAK